MRFAYHFEVNCHSALRAPRTRDRRIILLPDGNHRKHGRLDYSSGAERVVACASHLARRGDIERLLVCIASQHNVDKRPQSFFEELAAQFARLRARIAQSAVLVAEGIRCHARGHLARLRSMGSAYAQLVSEVESVADATRVISAPRMHVEFWLDYSDNLAWEQDVDLAIRTGAEEARVIRPGFGLPPSAACIVTTSLWPDTNPEDIEGLIDAGLRDRATHFAPGYDLAFIAEMLRALSASFIPAPLRLTIPVCASPEDIATMMTSLPALSRGPEVRVTYAPPRGGNVLEYGSRDDPWYVLHLVAASDWPHVEPDAFDAVIAPGQESPKIRLFAAAGDAPVHPCRVTVQSIVAALGDAVRFPTRHVQLRGADRSEINALAPELPWSSTLLELMHASAMEPHRSIEALVEARLPMGADIDVERNLLLEGISARVLAGALVDGLLLPDPIARQSDRNYAWTGAYMMLRVSDEANPSGKHWEMAATLAIRCMLALSTGDNGIFDRVFFGESAAEWRARLESAACFLCRAVSGDATKEMPAGRGSRLVEIVARTWYDIFDRYPDASQTLVEACRAALGRHYRANLDDYALEPASSMLVKRLGHGGAPRREALQRIEERYGSTTPAPVAARIRALCHADAGDPRRFADHLRELELLLHIADASPGMGIAVLFLVVALPTPAEFVTPERMGALLETAKLADHAFRLANDMSSLEEESGLDRDRQKRSSISILIPRGASATTRRIALEKALELGRETLAFLHEHLAHALARLRAAWPSMSEKVERAMLVGRGVYARGHYATLSSEQMATLIEDVSRVLHGPHDVPRDARPAHGAGDEPSVRQASRRHRHSPSRA